jgi:acyl-CoA synthetase (AMP-forming)/AMP-acid ligase II
LVVKTPRRRSSNYYNDAYGRCRSTRAVIALRQLLDRAARLHAARPCVIDDHGSFTFAEVHARAHALAAALQARGCVPGDRILVSLPNGLDAAIAEIAIPLGGFVKVGLHPRTGEQEARHVIESTTPAAVLASAESAPRLAISDDRMLLGGAHQSAGLATIAAAIQQQLPLREVAPGPHDLCTISHTSGSTGIPKGVMMTSRKMVSAILDHQASIFCLRPTDVVLSTSSLAVATGQRLLLTYLTGAAHVLPGASHGSCVAEAIERHRVTVAVMVTTILGDLCGIEGYWPRTLRLVQYGAAPSSAALIRKAFERLGPTLHQGYGMTEAGWTGAFLDPEDHRATIAGERPELLESVGRPFLGTAFRIFNDGADAPVGTAGEIVVGADHLFEGYWPPAAASSRDRLSPDGGWFASADLGRIDSNGYLYIQGRLDDAIISGGANVHPRQVELALEKLPGVREAVVVGLPDPRLGRRVEAVVILSPEASISEAGLLAGSRAALGRVRAPRRVHILCELPRLPGEKVDRAALTRRLQEDSVSN